MCLRSSPHCSATPPWCVSGDEWVVSGVAASIFTRIWSPPLKLSTSGWIEKRAVAIESGPHAYCLDRRRWESCWRDRSRGNGQELERAMDARGFVADPRQNRIESRAPPGADLRRGRSCSTRVIRGSSADPIGSEFGGGAPTRPERLSDAALIAALPDASLADACALAAEAGRRRLGDAVRALVALCNRFVGFGVDCRVPEQVAALELALLVERKLLDPSVK